ncbi:MAG TPA: hypothetical protein VF508_05010 [Pyrinomonadaceae bacterium]
MNKRLLLAGVLLLTLVTLTFVGLRPGRAQALISMTDESWPTIPGRQGDCSLNSMTLQMSCLDKLNTTWNKYYTSDSACPKSDACKADCTSDPQGAPCVQCVNDCTTRNYLAYYDAEQKLNTASCGVCGAQLDTCTGARAASYQCGVDYQNCGGIFVEGCWETYSACQLASGIDKCQ